MAAATERLPLRLSGLFSRSSAWRPAPSCRLRLVPAARKYSTSPLRAESIRPSTSTTTSPLADDDLSSLSIPSPSTEQIQNFDPLAQAKSRKTQLPPSRYSYRSPRFYRGPLHPHQPPPPSDPSSREFVPGPFARPRLEETWSTTLSHDLMTLGYHHIPPGTVLPEPAPRLRPWDDSSPYHKNRPLRGPRGRPALPLLRKPVTFRNVPTLSKISISALVREATSSSAHLHVAGMVLQAISTQRALVHIAKKSSAAGQRSDFTAKAGKPIAVGTTLEGEAMWHFLSTLVSVVLPRIKDWKGVRARAGDRSGNYGVGLSAEVVGGWPEIAVNYDAYPPQMIPGVDVVLQTTATNDRDARLLLSALGVPFQSGGR